MRTRIYLGVASHMLPADIKVFVAMWNIAASLITVNEPSQRVIVVKRELPIDHFEFFLEGVQ